MSFMLEILKIRTGRGGAPDMLLVWHVRSVILDFLQRHLHTNLKYVFFIHIHNRGAFWSFTDEGFRAVIVLPLKIR